MRLRPTAGAQRALDAPAEPADVEAIRAEKILNSRLDFRRPALYTASYSARRSNRQSRGRPSPGASDARKSMASLFAASSKNFSSTLALHTRAEAVLF